MTIKEKEWWMERLFKQLKAEAEAGEQITGMMSKVRSLFGRKPNV